jgi:hypothetical protein
VLVEFIAGINHFKNYLNFRRHGGIKYLVKKTNANVISTEFYSTIFEIVVLSK